MQMNTWYKVKSNASSHISPPYLYLWHKVPPTQTAVAMHRLSIVQGDASGVCPAAAIALAPYVVGLQVDSPCYLTVAYCSEAGP